MKHKPTFYTKFLVVLFAIFSLIISSGFSTWYIINSEDTTHQNSSSDTYHTVGIRYITTQTVLNFTTENGDPISYNRSNSEEAISIYNAVTSTNVETLYSSTEKEESTTSDGKIIITWSETKITLSKRNYSSGFLGIGAGYNLTGTTKIYNYTQTTARVIDDISDVKHKYIIKNGSKMKKPTLTREGFSFLGFLESSSDGLATTNVKYDFEKPVSKSFYIFAEWVENSDEGNLSLTKHINNLSGSSNIFSSSTTGFDLNLDDSYNSFTKTVSVGSPSVKTTLKAGATLNLTLESGSTNKEANEGDKITDVTGNTASSDKYISVDYTNKTGVANTKDYEYILQNDLYVYGTMVIGGITGATTTTSTGPQGLIMGNYVKLDLNGHNMYIMDGGIVHSFGLITDSVGTGKVEVQPGGTLKTQFVIFAMKGGNHTLWGYSKGICPFEHYTLPYIDCTVELINGETKSGCLDIFSKLNLGSLGFTNTYIPFLGKSTSKTYFVETIKKGSAESKTIIKPHKLEQLFAENSTNLIAKNLLYVKSSVDFINANASIKNISIGTVVFIDDVPIIGKIEKEFELDLSRVSFPVSPNIDFIFRSSDFTIAQNLTFMPGSSMYMDANSSLTLDFYKGESGGTTAVQKTFDSISVAAIKTLPGQTNYISGGIMALTENLTNSQKLVDSSIYGLFAADYDNYWKYFKEAQVTINGKINFVSGNGAPYKLSGNININNYSVNNGTNLKWNHANVDSLKSQVKLQTYDIEISAVNFVWFTGMTASENDETCSANRYFIAPLISHGDAYICETDSSINLIGKWDNDNGIFTASDNKTYFLKTNNQLLVDPNTKSSAIDYTLTPTQCTVTENHTIIDSNNQEYVYYAGYMVPGTWNAEDATKMDITATKLSTKTTVTTAISVKYTSVTYNGKTFYTWVKQ